MSDYAQAADAALLRPTGQMTLEMWVNPSQWRSFSGREQYGLVLFYKGALGKHIDYSFKLERDGWVCYGTTSEGAWLRRAAVPLNKWTHMAITFNSSARRLSLYINATRVGDFDTGSIGAYILPSSYPLFLGGFYQPYAYNNNNFIGRIADARVWHVERTAQQIKDNYLKQLKGNETGLSAYWNFSDRLDKSPNRNHLTLTGNAKLQANLGPNLQKSGSTLLVSPLVGTYASKGATGKTFSVTADLAWTTRVNAAATGWLTIASGKSGTGNGTVTYNVASNPGLVRAGTITVSGSNLTSVFTVNQWPTSAYAKVAADLDIDGHGESDLAVFHPAAGNWYTKFGVGVQWKVPFGWSATVPVPGDYDGDGIVDFAIYHPASGNWYILQSSDGATRKEIWGDASTVPLPGDYNNDGKTDLAFFRPSTGRWSFRMSGGLTQETHLSFGWASTIPVPADYDGDGVTDVAVYHTASGMWYILQSSFFPDINVRQVPWGWSTAIPVPADYDGDDKADIAVFHRATAKWYIKQSKDGDRAETFGWSTVTPVPADYDGDGVADIAVYHAASGKWYIRESAVDKTVEHSFGWSAAHPTLLYPMIHSWFKLP